MDYDPYAQPATEKRFPVYLESDMSRFMNTVWEYEPQDPFAVSVTFISESESNVWRFGRQIIRDALWNIPSQSGAESDVHISVPHDLRRSHIRQYLRLELINHDRQQEVQLLIPRKPLESFMGAVMTRVSDQQASAITQANIDRDLMLF